MAKQPTKPELMEALFYIQEAGKASVALLGRTMKVADSRANRILDRLEQLGYITGKDGSKARKILKTEPAARKRTRRSKKEIALSGREREGTGGIIDTYVKHDIENRLDSISGWIKQGMTIKQLAEWLEVSESTVYKWQQDRESFRDALRTGRQEADGEIMNSAHKASLERYVPVQKPMKVKKSMLMDIPKYNKDMTPMLDGDGNHLYVKELVSYETVEVVTVMEYVKPDAQLAMFMLRNKQAEYYKTRDRDHDEIVSGAGGSDKYSGMSDEELAAELARLESGSGQ